MGRGERNGKAHNKRDEKRPDRRGDSSGEVETGRVCETWEEAIRQGGVRSLGSSTWTRGGGKRWVMGGELVKDGEWVKGDRWRQEEHEGRDACHCTTQHRQGRCLSHTIHHVTPDKTHHKPSFTIKHPEISPGKKSTSRAASFASPSFPHALQTTVDVSRPVIHFHTPPDDTTLHSDSIHKNHPHLLLPIPLLDSFLRAPSTSSVTTTTPHSLDNVSGLNAPSRMTPPTTSLQHN